MRKRLKYSMASLHQSSTARVSCSLGTQLPELEDRERDGNEVPTFQGQMVSDLIHHLDTQKSMGLDGIHPGVLRELTEVLSKPLTSPG